MEGLVFLLELVNDTLKPLELSIQLSDAQFVLLQVTLGSLVLLAHQACVALQGGVLSLQAFVLLGQLGELLSPGPYQNVQSLDLLREVGNFGLSLCPPSSQLLLLTGEGSNGLLVVLGSPAYFSFVLGAPGLFENGDVLAQTLVFLQKLFEFEVEAAKFISFAAEGKLQLFVFLHEQSHSLLVLWNPAIDFSIFS